MLSLNKIIFELFTKSVIVVGYLTMKLPKCCTTVTPLSKTLAMILFVALPFIGFKLGQEYQKTFQLSSLSPTQKDNSLITPTTSISPVILTLVPRTFKLGSIGQYEYEFIWDDYKGPSEIIYSDKNPALHSKITLIKHLSGDTTTEKIAETSLVAGITDGSSGDWPFSLLSAPKNSPQVYISQGKEGSDGRSRMLVNLKNAKITFLNEILNNLDTNYMAIDPTSSSQRGIVFSCLDDKTKQESLYSLDIATGNVKKIKTLTSSLTYSCDSEGYRHQFSYQQINDQSISIDICAGSVKADKVTVNF